MPSAVHGQDWDGLREDSRAELRHWCFAFWRSATSTLA
jgi:hypothetical protein